MSFLRHTCHEPLMACRFKTTVILQNADAERMMEGCKSEKSKTLGEATARWGNINTRGRVMDEREGRVTPPQGSKFVNMVVWLTGSDAS